MRKENITAANSVLAFLFWRALYLFSIGIWSFGLILLGTAVMRHYDHADSTIMFALGLIIFFVAVIGASVACILTIWLVLTLLDRSSEIENEARISRLWSLRIFPPLLVFWHLPRALVSLARRRLRVD